jgi:hypothetical protein
MTVAVEIHNTGNLAQRAELIAIVEHVLIDRPGEWRVSIVGSRGSDNWEMTLEGPNGFERTYTLTGSAGEHRNKAIGSVLVKLLPPRKQ